MDKQTREKLIRHWEKERDLLQGVLQDARRERVGKAIEAQKELTRHSIKFAELAFGFGTAIVPLFFITDKLKDNELFVFVSAGFFLLSGFLGFFREKSTLEARANEIPDIGRDLEIDTYPRIYALNKLIAEPEIKEHLKEYFSSGDTLLEKYLAPEADVDRVDFGLDVQYGLALLGLFVFIKMVWPFSILYFWLLFLIVATAFLLFVFRSYMGYKDKRDARKRKKGELNEIRKSFVGWQKERFGGI